ncbi:MAG TPA: plastocyanin/azurin family copper-binding protein [Ktedonobacterales bacterium]
MHRIAGRSRHASHWLGMLALTLTLGLAACGGGTASGQPSATQPPTPTPTPTTAVEPTPTPTASLPPNTVQVRVANFLFSPSTLTIKKGITVLWTNASGTDHTVTGDAGNPAALDGAVGASGGTFSFTFTVPGTYHYHCAIHPIMKGTITVTS